MDIPDEEAVQQSKDVFVCHFDNMSEELILHIFGYTALYPVLHNQELVSILQIAKQHRCIAIVA